MNNEKIFTLYSNHGVIKSAARSIQSIHSLPGVNSDTIRKLMVAENLLFDVMDSILDECKSEIGLK